MNLQLSYQITFGFESSASMVNNAVGNARTVLRRQKVSHNYHSYFSFTSSNRITPGSFVHKNFTGKNPGVYVSSNTRGPDFLFQKVFLYSIGSIT